MGSRSQDELDEAAVYALYERIEKPLYNVIYRWLWNPEDARDVLQEAFARLWRMRERVDVETVEPLVYRIALNLASSRRRRAKLLRWTSLDAVGERADDAPTGEDRIVLEGARNEVRAAVDSLPEKLRRTVMLCELTDLKQEQVARILGIPTGTVGSRRHRALRLLRERLESEHS